jgi:DNA polymerase-3 subunit delta
MNNFNLKKIIYDIQKNDKLCYIIYGVEEFLIEKFKEIILEKFNQEKINIYINITINQEKDWEDFFYESKKKNFFFQKKIIILNISIKKINKKILKKIKKNKKIFIINIIIVILKKLNYKKILNIAFKNSFPKKKILIPCFKFKKKNYLDWIKSYFKKKQIDYSAQKYLYKKFNTDILSLNKNLDVLSLIYPKKKITKKKIKKIIFQKDEKNIFQWINALFLGKKKKSILILYCLYKKKYSPLYLIKYLETQINTLILLKKEKYNKEFFLYKKKIWKKNHLIYIRASQKNTYDNFLKIIQSLIWIKLSIKKIKEESIWIILKEISIIFN